MTALSASSTRYTLVGSEKLTAFGAAVDGVVNRQQNVGRYDRRILMHGETHSTTDG